MAEFWYKDATVWRKIKELWYKDAGVWRQAKELWYKDAGTWRKVFSPGFTSFAMASYSLFGTGDPEPGFELRGETAIRWNPTGQLETYETDAGYGAWYSPLNDWGRPLDPSGVAGADYEMNLTKLSESGSGGIQYTNITLGVWTSMASYNQVRTYGSVSGGTDKITSWNVKIRKVGTTDVLIDVGFSMRADSVNAM